MSVTLHPLDARVAVDPDEITAVVSKGAHASQVWLRGHPSPLDVARPFSEVVTAINQARTSSRLDRVHASLTRPSL